MAEYHDILARNAMIDWLAEEGEPYLPPEVSAGETAKRLACGSIVGITAFLTLAETASAQASNSTSQSVSAPKTPKANESLANNARGTSSTQGEHQAAVKHVVKENENLWTISQQHKDSLGNVLSRNKDFGDNPHLILPGDEVIVNQHAKDSASTSSATSNKASANKATSVQSSSSSAKVKKGQNNTAAKNKKPAESVQPESRRVKAAESHRAAESTREPANRVAEADNKKPQAGETEAIAVTPKPQLTSPDNLYIEPQAPATTAIVTITLPEITPGLISADILPSVIPAVENIIKSLNPSTGNGGQTPTTEAEPPKSQENSSIITPDVTLPDISPIKLPELIPDKPGQDSKPMPEQTLPAVQPEAPITPVVSIPIVLDGLPSSSRNVPTGETAALVAVEASSPVESRVNVDLVKGIVSNTETQANVEKYWPGVVKAFHDRGHKNDRMLLHMAATLKAEANFMPQTEIASGHAYDITVNPGLAKELGNIHPGDGKKFKGRGWQITGRNNYQRIGDVLGIDLVGNPELMNNPDVANASLVVFFELDGKLDKLIRALERGDLKRAREIYNGGSNGLLEVNKAYLAGEKLLKGAPVTDATLSAVSINKGTPSVGTGSTAVLTPSIIVDVELPVFVQPGSEVSDATPGEDEAQTDELTDVPVVEEDLMQPQNGQPQNQPPGQNTASGEVFTVDGPNGPINVMRNPVIGIVSEEIAAKLEALLKKADAEGIDLGGGSYRTRDAQIALRIQNCGGRSNYNIYHKPARLCGPPTAPPDASMHRRGKAIDFTCDGKLIRTRANNRCYVWLESNTAGFLRNLPSEPWHFSTNGH